ncbi:twin-arginine translocase TatA/TatE family subunit [Herbiconiux sp. 11R-BC]|uniref:twin-arginine translocase TatA/TatE family subunit n=1 Tax=Herbiconiux sp. 11R-BC TaxID=3111637 RepID=UPI003C0C270E
MLGNLTGWHLLLILAVILLLFGATRLPALSKSVGQSLRIFKSETRKLHEDEAAGEQPVKTEG